MATKKAATKPKLKGPAVPTEEDVMLARIVARRTILESVCKDMLLPLVETNKLLGQLRGEHEGLRARVQQAIAAANRAGITCQN